MRLCVSSILKGGSRISYGLGVENPVKRRESKSRSPESSFKCRVYIVVVRTVCDMGSSFQFFIFKTKRAVHIGRARLNNRKQRNFINNFEKGMVHLS